MADVAKDAVLSPQEKAMLEVNTEVGDDKATLGANVEVDSDKVDNVVGRDDVKNTAQTINQTNVPTSWFVVGVLSFFLMTTLAVIGWLMPVPKWEIGRAHV